MTRGRQWLVGVIKWAHIAPRQCWLLSWDSYTFSLLIFRKTRRRVGRLFHVSLFNSLRSDGGSRSILVSRLSRYFHLNMENFLHFFYVVVDFSIHISVDDAKVCKHNLCSKNRKLLNDLFNDSFSFPALPFAWIELEKHQRKKSAGTRKTKYLSTRKRRPESGQKCSKILSCNRTKRHYSSSKTFPDMLASPTKTRNFLKTQKKMCIVDGTELDAGR